MLINDVKDARDLKRQYHKEAKRCHPDMPGGSNAKMQQLNAEALYWANELGRQKAHVQRGVAHYTPQDNYDYAPQPNYFTNQGPVWGSLDPNSIGTFNIDDAIADALARHLCNLVDSDSKMFITSVVWLVLVALAVLLVVSVVANGRLFSIGM